MLIVLENSRIFELYLEKIEDKAVNIVAVVVVLVVVVDSDPGYYRGNRSRWSDDCWLVQEYCYGEKKSDYVIVADCCLMSGSCRPEELFSAAG